MTVDRDVEITALHELVEDRLKNSGSIKLCSLFTV